MSLLIGLVLLFLQIYYCEFFKVLTATFNFQLISFEIEMFVLQRHKVCVLKKTLALYVGNHG